MGICSPLVLMQKAVIGEMADTASLWWPDGRTTCSLYKCRHCECWSPSTSWVNAECGGQSLLVRGSGHYSARLLRLAHPCAAPFPPGGGLQGFFLGALARCAPWWCGLFLCCLWTSGSL